MAGNVSNEDYDLIKAHEAQAGGLIRFWQDNILIEFTELDPTSAPGYVYNSLKKKLAALRDITPAVNASVGGCFRARPAHSRSISLTSISHATEYTLRFLSDRPADETFPSLADDSVEAFKRATVAFEPPTPARQAEALRLRDASEALDRVLDSIGQFQRWDQEDERAAHVSAQLERYILDFKIDALVELQVSVLSERLDPELRGVLLEALAECILPPDLAAYRRWIVSQALRSPSHFVRDAAVTAILAVRGDKLVLQQVATIEQNKRIQRRMLRVLEKLG